jgi:hypothetical protein
MIKVRGQEITHVRVLHIEASFKNSCYAVYDDVDENGNEVTRIIYFEDWELEMISA